MKTNKIIAEFMGYKVMTESQFDSATTPLPENIMIHEAMHYHDDWSELMPVVERIESLGYSVCIEKNVIEIFDQSEELIFGTFAPTKIQSTYNAVVRFIEGNVGFTQFNT